MGAADVELTAYLVMVEVHSREAADLIESLQARAEKAEGALKEIDAHECRWVQEGQHRLLHQAEGYNDVKIIARAALNPPPTP